MECEPEELRSLGAAGICRASAQILRGPHRPLFARIAAALVLPLSALFFLHIAIYHVLFFRLFDDDDASTPGSDARRCLYNRVAFDYAALLAFKAAYLVALLVLSLLATAAAVFEL